MKDIIQWRRESKSWIDKEKEEQVKGAEEGKSASEQPPVYVFMRAAAAASDNTKPN